MNKILRALAVGTILLTAPLTGCNKRLDIEPVDAVPADRALNSSADVESLLRGAYATIGSSDLYGGRLQYTADLLGDPAGDASELRWQGTFAQPNEFYRKDITKVNSFVTNTWTQAYQAINIANTVLANLSKVTANRRDRVEGEAEFIRGVMYFELVRFYARDWSDGSPSTNPGVPIILTATNVQDPGSVSGAAAKVSRKTAAEVYTQVLTDLIDAKKKLDKFAPPSTTATMFATTYAASGMLSRVYLQQRKYELAAKAADNVISSGIFRLATLIGDEFVAKTNTPEDVFATQVNVQSGANDLNTFYSTNGRGGDIAVTNAHLDLYEADDDRGYLFNDDNGVLTTKFDDPYANIHVMRLSEMFLTRAEGNFRAGTKVGASPLDDINAVRKRAKLASLKQDDLNLDQIFLERHLELAFEGFYLHDFKRFAFPVGTLKYDSPKLIFPIPQREIEVNPNLTQNKGY